MRQLRSREEGDNDSEEEFAPHGDHRDDHEVMTPDFDDERRHINVDEQGIDRRPAPRAEDYLAPRDDRGQERMHDDRRPRRDEAEAGEYRSNDRRPGRGAIQEEPLYH